MPKKRRRSYRRANIEVTEDTYLPGIIETLQDLVTREVHIGAQGDEELAMIAGIHEYGSIKAGIPARSFIGSGKKKAQTPIARVVKEGVVELVTGNLDADDLLRKIGDVGKERVLKNFDKLRTPPLSPIYAKRKGNKKILRDEEQLRESITAVIVPKRGGRR
ncbi:hypothetical protein [Paenibacillus campinasensis]|uniref:Uncharacterized protein n=1 Tax=Paenibacillus campinasensis TaxID=66347 RepID=A0A268EKQ5_9BACL|nr:hypothetical protein [Paenibacillus campinasensis]PAD73674.1 hypothetical protein CHH67_19760 [Paenibacillus campinasensis]